MANPARPKRSAEAHARYASPSSHSNKKPRFDARNPSTLAPDLPDEDAILELDEIGKGGQQTKRNAVNLDGYETDSSDENFDARAEAKAELARQESAAAAGGSKSKGKKNVKSQDEEDNDMFADLDEDMAGTAQNGDGDDDEELSREGKKAKKDVRFLDVSEIEGQVHSSTSGGHVSADFTAGGAAQGIKGKGKAEQDGSDSDSDDIDAEDDAAARAALDPEDAGSDAEELGAGSKKHHAPKLDAFNMAAEGEEGRFDEAGNFVRKAADPDAVHDNWLDGLSKKDMKRARDAAEKRELDRRRKNAADDALLTSDLLSALIARLERGETVLEALQRLAAAGKKKKEAKKKPKWMKNRKTVPTADTASDEMDVDAVADKEVEDPVESARKEAVEAITAAADQLFSRDQQDIYDQEREVLMRQYKRETGEDWVEPASASAANANGNGAHAASSAIPSQWEYRWSDARDGGERHGPYDGPTMLAWNEAGYFGEGVEFRRVGEGEWSRVVEFH